MFEKKIIKIFTRANMYKTFQLDEIPRVGKNTVCRTSVEPLRIITCPF